MEKNKIFCGFILAVCIATLWIGRATAVAAAGYELTEQQLMAEKSAWDDPRPIVPIAKKLLPPAVYKSFCHDIGKMQELQAKVVGFKSPDLVGKIAPEITPGKYTYQDKGNKPGLKALMIPLLYDQFFTKGGPPLAGCFPEIEVVPTRQVYNTLPELELTLKNLGKTKQDARGFIDWKTWDGGIPFPKPSGSNRIKAMQILYNFLYHHFGVDDYVYLGGGDGYDKNFRQLSTVKGFGYSMTTAGRVSNPPYGWLDKRAKDQGELSVLQMVYFLPRDVYGNATQLLTKLPLEEPNLLWAYAAALRRIRKLSGTDSQDTTTGVNAILDDANGFNRKISPTVYPNEYTILEEREFLAPAYDTEGKYYYTHDKNVIMRNFKFERRPMYVIDVKSLDPSYVYSHSLLYVDKETFDVILNIGYDRMNRMWRSGSVYYLFNPEIAWRIQTLTPCYNYLTVQSSIGLNVCVPVTYLKREDLSLANLGRMAQK